MSDLLDVGHHWLKDEGPGDKGGARALCLFILPLPSLLGAGSFSKVTEHPSSHHRPCGGHCRTFPPAAVNGPAACCSPGPSPVIHHLFFRVRLVVLFAYRRDLSAWQRLTMEEERSIC